MKADTDDLVALSIRAIPKILAPGPAYVSRSGAGWVLALSGEPAADLNMALVGDAADPEAVLREATALADGVPLLALFLPVCAERLAPVATGLGFVHGGAFPLMALSEPRPSGAGSGFTVERVGDGRTRTAAADLQSRGFRLKREAMTRLLDDSLALPEPPQVFVASLDGEPMSTVTATPDGADVGIWTMATPPEHQGKGAGRALLGSVLANYWAAGVTRAYLFATEAGQPLYRSLGFETVAPLSAWVKGTSTQVAQSAHA